MDAGRTHTSPGSEAKDSVLTAVMVAHNQHLPVLVQLSFHRRGILGPLNFL